MATQVRPASEDQAEFLAQLIGEGLLLESGVPGVYGHGAAFEDARSRLDERLSAEAASRGAERLRFPPVLPRRQLESSGYLASFPHLAGTVYSFDGDERPEYVASLASVTGSDATLYVLCFSDVGPDTGPHPVSRDELAAPFGPGSGWNVAGIEAGRVLTRFHDDHGAPAWLATVKRI